MKITLEITAFDKRFNPFLYLTKRITSIEVLNCCHTFVLDLLLRQMMYVNVKILSCPRHCTSYIHSQFRKSEGHNFNGFLGCFLPVILFTTKRYPIKAYYQVFITSMSQTPLWLPFILTDIVIHAIVTALQISLIPRVRKMRSFVLRQDPSHPITNPSKWNSKQTHFVSKMFTLFNLLPTSNLERHTKICDADSFAYLARLHKPDPVEQWQPGTI